MQMLTMLSESKGMSQARLDKAQAALSAVEAIGADESVVTSVQQAVCVAHESLAKASEELEHFDRRRAAEDQCLMIEYEQVSGEIEAREHDFTARLEMKQNIVDLQKRQDRIEQENAQVMKEKAAIAEQRRALQVREQEVAQRDKSALMQQHDLRGTIEALKAKRFTARPASSDENRAFPNA